MSELVKVEALTAAELLQHFELVEEGAEQCIVADTAPEVSIDRLAQAGLFLDAIKLLAHGLPKRIAVWWACLASRAAQTPDTDEVNVNALLAAEAWAKNPTEENRLRCKAFGEASKHQTAAGWVATAAAWCTGSMAAEGEPEIPPPEHLYAHAVAGSICLAASQDDPDNAQKKYAYFLQQGLDLARGGNGQV